MKKQLIKAACLALLLVFTALPMLTVSAELVQADSVYLEEQKDIVFWVEWDVAQPVITFIAPNGTVYDPTTERSDTETLINGNALFYIVHDAQAGQWRVEYDKGANQKLEVSVHDYTGGIYVEKFTVSAPDGDWMDVSFLVNGKEGVTFNYRISAVVERSGSEKELRSGTHVTGREETTSVPLSSLSSYSAYMLKLYVWYDDGGTDVFDMVFSDPFAYTNPNADSKVVPYEVIMIPDEYLVHVRFGDLPWGCDTVLIALFEDDKTEPVTFTDYEVESGQTVELSYDPRAVTIGVEVTAKVEGVNGTPQRTDIVPKNLPITLPEGELFNSLVLPVKYSGFTKQNVDIEVNGTKSAVVFDGSGLVNVDLVDDWNQFSLSYKDAAGVIWKLQRKLFVDRIAPTLTMSQAYDGISTEDDKLLISGTASGCYTLTINGAAVKVGENGHFSHTVSLSGGANSIAVVAADKAGNEARYAAKVYYGDADAAAVAVDSDAPGGLFESLTAQGSYWFLLGAGVICLLLVGYALIFWRKGDKQ